MDYQIAVQKIEEWLLHSGFRAANFPPLKTIYFRDDNKNPDQVSGANFVIIETLDRVTTPEQLKPRCEDLYLASVKFFKKGMGSIKLAKNFTSFLIFPISEQRPNLFQFITRTRLASNDFSGSYTPIVIDLSACDLYYYTPAYSQTMQMGNRVADQIDLLFLTPLLPSVVIPETLVNFINILRKTTAAKDVLATTRFEDMNVQTIKRFTRRLFYEGSMDKEDDSSRKLLYALYLSEFLLFVENQVDQKQFVRSEGLSLRSFMSRDQFITDSIDSLGRTMIGSFQIGFDQSLRSIAIKDQWEKIIKNQSIKPYAYCRNCQKVVMLIGKNGCPASILHNVESPSYFHESEVDAIQDFCSRRRQ